MRFSRVMLRTVKAGFMQFIPRVFTPPPGALVASTIALSARFGQALQ
jgi:hypothetical protein